MFSIYKTIHPPTGIEHAVWARFLSPTENNLIITSANHLYVYRINSSTKKFECLHTFILWGNVCTITVCRLSSISSKDILFLSFLDAKLSLIEFDSTIQDLKTLSMHYFEDELTKEGQWFNYSTPIVRVDPDMRCACMLIYNSKLVIIPFFSQLDREIITGDSSLSLATNLTPNCTTTRNTSLSSYIVDLKKLDLSLSGRIIDLQFLHSYYEPTLFILCESSRTWVGRVALKKDTCCSVALSINVAQKSNPVIWPVDKLPYDCLSCLSVPKPIGGVLVLATNSIIYLNQSIPTYAVALNSLARDSTKYPLRPLYDLKFALDLAIATFIANDKVLISLKTGDIYLLTLHTDTMRTMKEFTFDRIGSTVVANCLCKCDDSLIFFGSRLGDSVLLRLNEKVIIDPTSIDTIETMNDNEDENDDNNNNNAEQNDINSENNNDNNNQLDFFVPNKSNEVTFFTSEFGAIDARKASVNYSFEYCDHLLNIGPCGYGIVGEGDSEETRMIQQYIPQQYQTTPLDFITTSGTSKSGSISILQQTIKPELITTQSLQGSIDMWTVYTTKNSLEQKREHAFILISQETSTLILQTGVNITELEQGGFLTNEETIFCGNLADEYIVQVTRLHLVLLRHSTQLQIIPYENNPIRFATSLDRYLAILTTHGVISIYILSNENTDQPKLVSYCQLNDKQYTCINLYLDQSGLFSTTVQNSNSYQQQFSSNMNSPKQQTNYQQKSLPNPLVSNEFPVTGDDEDEWLYVGKTFDNPLPTVETMDSSTVTETQTTTTTTTRSTSLTRWLIAISRDGTLTIHELMTDKTEAPIIRYEIPRFNNALKILVDIHDTLPFMTNYLGKIDTSTSAFVYEILVIGLGENKDRVYILVC